LSRISGGKLVSTIRLPSVVGPRRGVVRAVVMLAIAASVLFAPALPAQTSGTGADGLLPIPALSAHVTDLAQMLSPAERQALEAKLADWEARTTNQLAVLIVPTTHPEPIEAYSIRVAEKWRIGHTGKDNGVLLLAARDDRKLRIEVGYGLEGTLTDVTARRIIAESIAPLFREGKFAAGIEAGADRIIAVVAEGRPLPPLQAGNVQRSSGNGFDFGGMLMILFIAVPIVGGVLRAIFGKLVGSTIGAGIIGAAAWFAAGSIVIAIIAVIVGFVVMIFVGTGSALAGGRGIGLPMGGGWTGGGGGGGSWSGGGFGGGGASGGWD
jgi:uncharacterized protein